MENKKINMKNIVELVMQKKEVIRQSKKIIEENETEIAKLLKSYAKTKAKYKENNLVKMKGGKSSATIELTIKQIHAEQDENNKIGIIYFCMVTKETQKNANFVFKYLKENEIKIIETEEKKEPEK